MEQREDELSQDSIACPICLDLLCDPVTIPCGHSHCMSCIKSHWDGEDQEGVHSCPQCGQTFRGRPALKKNVTLSELVEKLQRDGLKPSRSDHGSAGPEDVACDVCTGVKLKAVQSCLVCLASYCEKHIQLHYESSAFEKHKLVDPRRDLQESICSLHDEVMKIFCRTDEELICYLCLMDEHKDHETVSLAAERAEKQKELQVSRQQIQQRIQDQEDDVKLLQQEVEAINVSADKAVEDSEKIFTELIRLLQERSSDVKQQIRSQQETEVSRVKHLQEKLEQEITDLKRKDTEMEQLSNTEDHNQFLHNYPSLSALSESTNSSSIKIRPLRHFKDVMAAVSELRDKIQDIMTEVSRNISCLVSDVDVLISHPEPETRADFLMYAREMTFNPNSACMELEVSESNKKVTFLKEKRPYVHHLERFTFYCQVLSKECLLGRSYCEVEKKAEGVDIGFAYKSIRRAGRFDEIMLGSGEYSWSLNCVPNQYAVWHDADRVWVSEPTSNRIGLYVDLRAGVLAFYSVSDSVMTLLHRVQTRFSEPLHVALRFFSSNGDSVEFLNLK